jgi:hypothetical protein
MSNFYDLLGKIRTKPGLYLGVPSVSSLHMLLCGYAFSRQEQGITLTSEEREFELFQEWVQQRFKISASVSWAKIILLYSMDERSGFDLFFELWDEFLKQRCERLNNREEFVTTL